MKLFRSFMPGAFFASLALAAPAAVFTVTNNSSADIPGSFARAVAQANAASDLDTIRFMIGAGSSTIVIPYTVFLYSPVILDATTQSGFDGRPIVTIKPNGSAYTLLSLYGSAGGSVVRGLAFAGTIKDSALRVKTDNVTVEDCWFGVDKNNNQIGNGNTAILLGEASSTYSNLVINRCVIGSYLRGIDLMSISDSFITDCAIGTDFPGTVDFPVGSEGIRLQDCTNVYIGAGGGEGNIIRNCAGAGIGTVNAATTIIQGNRIYDTGGLPIDYDLDHYVSYPDNLDADIAAGKSQNIPEIKSVTRSVTTIHVSGQLLSVPSKTYTVEIYASDTFSSDGSSQAKYKVESFNVSTDATGLCVFDRVVPNNLPPGKLMIFAATATRTDHSWGTSELSNGIAAETESLFSDATPDLSAGWIPSGVDSGPEYPLDPGSLDDVDLAKDSGALHVIVRPSISRNRIAGWTNPSLVTLSDNSSSIIRGKFYVYCSNPLEAPLNEVPSFRLRLENEAAVLASLQIQCGMTGRTSPVYEPFYASTNNAETENIVGPSIRPSNNPAKPSLYKVDLMVPAVDGVRNSRIGATFESMVGEDPANGVLSVTEIQLAAYAETDSPNVLMMYTNDSAFQSYVALPDPATPYSISSGQFNAEADFQPGRRQALDLPGEVPPSQLTKVEELSGHSGTLLDTSGVPANKLGVGLFNVAPDVSTSAPRVMPGRTYWGLFVVSSDMPTVATSPGEPAQAGMNFQLQTGGGAVTSRLELVGPPQLAGPVGSKGRTILEQMLPGLNCENSLGVGVPFPVGKQGGIYLVSMPSPLSPDIRSYTPGDLGPWALQPGPGVAAPSLRDISLGVNVITHPSTLRVSPSMVIPWAEPNRGCIWISGIVLADMPDIDDGGYTY